MKGHVTRMRIHPANFCSICILGLVVARKGCAINCIEMRSARLKILNGFSRRFMSQNKVPQELCFVHQVTHLHWILLSVISIAVDRFSFQSSVNHLFTSRKWGKCSFDVVELRILRAYLSFSLSLVLFYFYVRYIV